MIRIYRHLFGAAWTGWQLARGRPERAYRRALELSQYLDHDSLLALQWEKLRKLLTHAYDSVPFYRARFDAAGLSRERIRTWDDFRRLPELTKTDVRNHLPDLLSRRPGKGIRKLATSGSTGIPLEFYLDNEYEAFLGKPYPSRSWYGFARGDKVAYITGETPLPSQRERRQRILSRLERRRRLDAFQVTEEGLARFARGLEVWKPDFIVGYSSILHLVARYMDRNEVKISTRAVQSYGECLWDFQRADIESVFACPLIDLYGSKRSGPIASQCLVRDGLHVMADLRLVEILDETGRPAPPGMPGRVVITDFTNYTMPFIRYIIGDLARWKPEAPCTCGRTLPRLEAVEGRSTDISRTNTEP